MYTLTTLQIQNSSLWVSIWVRSKLFPFSNFDYNLAQKRKAITIARCEMSLEPKMDEKNKMTTTWADYIRLCNCGVYIQFSGMLACFLGFVLSIFVWSILVFLVLPEKITRNFKLLTNSSAKLKNHFHISHLFIKVTKYNRSNETDTKI